MFKENRKYLYIFLGLFALVIAAQYLLPKPVSWNRTYLSKDKNPFGCYALYNLLDGVYSKQITFNNKTIYNLKDQLKGKSSVLMINDNFNLSKIDVRTLFEVVEEGNTVFMAAESFDGLLADTFHIKTVYGKFNFFASIDSLLQKPGDSIKLCAKNLSKKTYNYEQLAGIRSFWNFDTTRFKIMATLPGNRACLIGTQIGKGKLYLMSSPDIFGNYFIVNHPNRELVYSVMSLLKNDELVWDENYKTFNVKSTSPLKFILASDTLYAGYLLMLFSIFIYMIFEGRRRQRPIPIAEPVTNSTLKFVNVISHVYYNSKNHQSIATEKIKYFYETIRKKFAVNTNEINELLFMEISELSGIELKKVKQLFVYCENLKTAKEISEYDLVELNRQISNFNKNSLR